MSGKIKVTRVDFGRIVMDGKEFDRDLIIDRGEIKKRKKKSSKPLRGHYGHTPLTPAENIPWKCKRLVIGTGHSGMLPVVDELKEEAEKRGIELLILKTTDALRYLNEKGTNLVLHLTC
jgi:hypothetical protein